MAWPVIAAIAASALASYLGSRSKSNAAKDQANLYNDWRNQYSRTGSTLLNQATDAGWNPFAPKVSTMQGTNYSSGGGAFNTQPVITPQYAPLDAMMRGIMSNRLASGSSLPAGYAENAIRGINESFEGADQAARNMAARRGLSGEQTYAIASPANRARAGQIADLRGSLPLLARELQNQDIGITSGLQSAFGRGESGSNTSYSTGGNFGVSTTPFGASDISALMNILVPPGPQQTTQTGISPTAEGLSSLGALMGFLAANQGSGQQSGGQYGGQTWPGFSG